ncbi:YkvA family protein [Halomonas sp. PR-M31]|uniref:YkvA family protein n=1 Tax=Halomonas sp. PR-M31 TaxID=1471202 RepID=UPI0009E29947|nr:YkvA family protein [Halomonas sp. PR-M31]
MEQKLLTHDAKSRKHKLPVLVDEDNVQYDTLENKSQYSDEAFWNKVSRYAKKAGKTTLEPGLKLYYSAQDPDTPVWAKTTIYGALGYFIFPLDTIPDVTPFVGYTDDVSVLVGALAVVAAHIKKEHTSKARAVLKRWFGE